MHKVPARSFVFNLGGIGVEFIQEDANLRLRVSNFYSTFLSSLPIEFSIKVHQGLYIFEEAVVYQTGFWSYHFNNKTHVFRMTTSQGGVFLQYSLVLDSNLNRGDMYISPASGCDYSPNFSLEVPPALLDELLAAQILSGKQGLQIHACGLITINGNGLLFSGVSGSGKSTTASIWQESSAGQLLSDERVSIRKKNGCFWLHGTPWHGTGFTSTSLSAPLEKIFIIHHASKNQFTRLKSSEAMSALLIRSYLPHWDPVAMENTMGFLAELCQTIPCFELGFVPDQDMIDFVLNKI